MSRSDRKPRLVVNGKALIRLGLFAGFVLLLALILPKSYRVEFSYDVGKPWMANDLVAAFSFPLYKTDAETKEEQTRVLQSVVPVFTEDLAADSLSHAEISRAWTNLFAVCDSLKALGAEKFLAEFPVILKEQGIEQPEIGYYISNRLDRAGTLLRFMSFPDSVMRKGFIGVDPARFSSEILFIRTGQNTQQGYDKIGFLNPSGLAAHYRKCYPYVSEEELAFANAFLFRRIFPNYIFSEELTRQEEELQMAKLSPVKELIPEGRVIIRYGEEVTSEADFLLKSYSRARKERFGENRFWQSLLGEIGMVGMVTLLLALFLRSNRPRIFYRNRKVAFILVVIFLMMVIAELTLMFSLKAGKLFGVNFLYLVPACMVPLIITAFFDLRVGFFVNILQSILIGALISNGFEYFFVQFCAGTVSVYSVTKLRNRGDFFFSLLYIFVAYVLAYMVYSLYSTGRITPDDGSTFILFAVSVLLTFIAYPLIWVFERLFRMTSELTYVELLDTNHPLLKELFNRAPGTFHHSLQVANISEAVIRRIGGNSLLARVGGLFHDIGKMENPRFFIENQGEGQSPHEKIGFEQSAGIIIRHVHDGVRMALQHNLPREVIDFIRTHHGTSRVEFFFRRYSAEHKGEMVDENRFRYPGPLPFTRETAVVMIVDSVEAACRAMTSRHREDLKNLIDKIIEHKISLRQLDHANITFKDLQDIKTVVLEQLMNIYHERVAYPAMP